MAKGTTRLRRTFTPQFKKDAVRLVVEEGKSLTEVSAHLGIARSLLQRWREQLSSKPAPEVFPGHGRVTGTMPLLRASSTRSRPNGFTIHVRFEGPGSQLRLRLHRGLLQSQSLALLARLL